MLWHERMLKNIAEARRASMSAEDVLPLARNAADRAVRAAAGSGGQVQVQIQPRASAVVIAVQGRGADRVKQQIGKELARRLPDLRQRKAAEVMALLRRGL